MKKLCIISLCSIIFVTNVSAISFFENSYEFPNNCEISHVDYEYSSCLHLSNGNILLNFDENEHKYVLIDKDGQSQEIYSDYKITGEDDFGHLIISADTDVISTELMRFISVEKFGLLNSDFSLLLEPILDNYSLYPSYFVPDFDNYGLAKVYYGSQYYSLDDKFLAAFNIYSPVDENHAFLTENGELITDFDEIYCDFVTENRYLVKIDGIYSLIDSDFNIIATDFLDIAEVDFGKFSIAKSGTEQSPVFDTLIDQNGNILSNFDITSNNLESEWAELYIYLSPYTISSSFSQTFEGLDQNLYTQNLTRIGFCKLIINFLHSKDYDFPEINDFEVFSDTKDADVLIARNLGIINGTSATTFSPYEEISREDVATIIHRLCGILNIYSEKSNEIDYFSDFSSFSDYSVEAILSISSLDSFDGFQVMTGTSNSVFSPKSNITLEQALTILVRLYNF